MSSRPALFRIFRVATLIRNSTPAKRRLTVDKLAVELNCCTKTINRDIDFLKDLGAPIYFSYDLACWIWNPMLETPWYFGGKLADPRLPSARHR